MNSGKRLSNGKTTILKPVNGTIWQRALKAGSLWPDKDEFLDVVYWMRQVIALITGLVWGFTDLQGLLGIILFLVVNCAIVFFYSTKYQNIDDEEYGGPLEIIKEGLFTAFSVFLVAWITIFTAIHNPSS